MGTSEITASPWAGGKHSGWRICSGESQCSTAPQRRARSSGIKPLTCCNGKGLNSSSLAGSRCISRSQWAVASTASCRCARGCRHQRRPPLLPPVPSTTAAPQAGSTSAGSAAASNAASCGVVIAVVQPSRQACSSLVAKVRRSPSASRSNGLLTARPPTPVRDLWQTRHPPGASLEPGQGRRGSGHLPAARRDAPRSGGQCRFQRLC